MDILPRWPDLLGLPIQSGYKHTVTTLASTAMTAGIGRVRRNTDIPVSDFSVSFVWTDEQLKAFRLFARQDLEGASGWFVIPLWSGGSVELQTIRIKSANKYQLNHPYWSVSLVLECPDRYQLPDDIGDVLLEWNPADLINAGKIAERSLCELGSIFSESMMYQERIDLLANSPFKFSSVSLKNASHHFLQINDVAEITVRATLSIGDPVVDIGVFTGPGIFPLTLSLKQFELVANADTVAVLSGN